MREGGPKFVFGDFEYEVIADNVIRISCGPEWEMATTFRDFRRGARRGLKCIEDYEAKCAQVVPIKRGHAARS